MNFTKTSKLLLLKFIWQWANKSQHCMFPPKAKTELTDKVPWNYCPASLSLLSMIHAIFMVLHKLTEVSSLQSWVTIRTKHELSQSQSSREVSPGETNHKDIESANRRSYLGRSVSVCSSAVLTFVLLSSELGQHFSRETPLQRNGIDDQTSSF